MLFSFVFYGFYLKNILYFMGGKATNNINIFSTSRVKEKSYSTK